jgi:four helix bundle suffix protein
VTRPEIESAQLDALRTLLAEILPGNRFYAAKLAAAGVGFDVAGLSDFTARFPFTTKAELAADQQAHAPWGTNLTYPLAAYTLINLCHRTLFLLRRQVDALGQRFLDEGGFKEHMHRCREEARSQAPQAPECPVCGKSMRSCTAKSGPKAGHRFWGCRDFPACKGIRELAEKA